MIATEKSPGGINAAFADYEARPGGASLEALAVRGEALVKHFAALYGGGCSFDDLYQSGMLGLMKAVKSYDGRAAFSTWASCCIISEIRHYVRRERVYRRPECVSRLQETLDGLVEEDAREGRLPTGGALAERVGLAEESLPEVMRAGLVEFSEINVSKIVGEQQSFHLPIEDRIALEQAMEKLSALQRKVIDALFYRGLTQEQTAAELGINQRRVSRIKEKALSALAGLLGEPNFRLTDGEGFKRI